MGSSELQTFFEKSVEGFIKQLTQQHEDASYFTARDNHRGIKDKNGQRRECNISECIRDFVVWIELHVRQRERCQCGALHRLIKQPVPAAKESYTSMSHIEKERIINVQDLQQSYKVSNWDFPNGWCLKLSSWRNTDFTIKESLCWCKRRIDCYQNSDNATVRLTYWLHVYPFYFPRNPGHRRSCNLWRCPFRLEATFGRHSAPDSRPYLFISTQRGRASASSRLG